MVGAPEDTKVEHRKSQHFESTFWFVAFALFVWFMVDRTESQVEQAREGTKQDILIRCVVELGGPIDLDTANKRCRKIVYNTYDVE